MTDPLQSAVEVLARELSCDLEDEWAARVNCPEAAAGAETFRVEARRILAEIAPMIEAAELLRVAGTFDVYAEDCDEFTRRGMGQKTRNKHRAECWREVAQELRERAGTITKASERGKA